MRVEIIEDNFPIEKWNEKAVHPLQSWQWGEARKKLGITVIRIAEFNGSQLMDVYQMTLHRLPFGFKLGYIPRSRTPSKAVLQFLIEYAKKHSIIFIKLEPNEQKSKSLNDVRLTSSSHPLFPEWTMVLDLTKSEEELLKEMKPKTRYNIRLAEKKGVVVKEESNDEGFKKFSDLYFETTDRQKYYGHNRNYHQIIWKSLKDSIAHILIAYFDNIPIAAYELFSFNGVFYYPYGGTSSLHRNVMGPNLLMWEAVRLGKKLGATSFDMWGALPPNYQGDTGWAGFTRFKEGYNAQFVQMIGSFDLIINPALYKLYNWVYTLREMYLKLRKT